MPVDNLLSMGWPYLFFFDVGLIKSHGKVDSLNVLSELPD